MKHRINIGDKVTVMFYNGTIGNCIDGYVQYMPAAAGDTWIILDRDNNVHYVQNFSEIIKYKQYNENSF